MSPDRAPDYLGPTTEARFERVFSAAAVITKRAAAELIGLDEKTLDALTATGVVRAVRRGKLNAYTERDLRAYLTEGSGAPCPSTSRRTAASTTMTSNIVAGDFMARRAAKHAGKPKR